MSALYEKGQSALSNFTQFFEIQNLGPSDVLESRFRISLQAKTKQGQAIIKLTSKPHVTEGVAVCQQSPDADSLMYIVINCTAKRLIQSEHIKLQIAAQLDAEGVAKVTHFFPIIPYQDLNFTLNFSVNGLQFGNTTDSFTLVSLMTANITSMLYDQQTTIIPQESTRLELRIKKLTPEDYDILQAMPPWIYGVIFPVALIILIGTFFGLRRVKWTR